MSYEKTLVHDELPPEELRTRQVTLRAEGLPPVDKLLGLPGAGAALDSAIESWPMVFVFWWEGVGNMALLPAGRSGMGTLLPKN